MFLISTKDVFMQNKKGIVSHKPTPPKFNLKIILIKILEFYCLFIVYETINIFHLHFINFNIK